MSHRCLISAGALAVVIASVSLAVEPMAAQGRTAGAKPFTPPPATYTPPRTPWGDPDLQGVYDYQNLIKIERPPELGGKTTFNTDAELAEWVKVGARGNAQSADRCGEGTRANEKCPEAQDRDVGSYNEFWNNRNYVKDNRTSLLVDPPDGRFPPLTPEAEKRRREIIAQGYNGTKWASWEDAHPLTRCIASQTPNGPMAYNGAAYMMQTPGWVLIVRERLDTRLIALDGRAHIGQNIRQWNGDSVGHWEGNVLVVDTTNFTDRQRGGGGFSGVIVPAGIPFGNFHLTERFVPVSANRIHYYATVEDPKTWTRPWTIMLPWERDLGYQIYEYACNEGNYSVGAALHGERVLEAEAAKKGNK